MRQSATAILCWMLLEVFCVHAKLNLIYHYDVESVQHKRAQLLCKIDSDKVVKKVVWYRLTEESKKTHVYYYEPPKFNTSGPSYNNRVRLASDRSSLVILSAEKKDEGLYECHVAVVRNTSNFENEIPEEAWQTMKLTVHVPPTAVKLNSFTSNNNMTLTCRSSGSKPQTDIFWLVQRKNEVKEYRSAKIITEYQGELADTIGYFYIPLSYNDQGTTIFCIVNHPETETNLRENVTLVSPALIHPVMMYFDWLGGEVPYSGYGASDSEEKLALPPSGLVEMLVTPSQVVEGNTTVIVTVTSEGSFPEPRYTWWSEDLDLRSGRVIRIDSIQRNQQLFCLVENPIGRVVVSMQLTVSGADSADSDSESSYPGEVATSGVMIMAIVFGSLVLVLIVAFLVYYCAFKPANENTLKTDREEVDDFHSYMVKQKLPDSDDQPTGQAKISSYHVEPELLNSNEKQALLKTSLDSPNLTPEKYRKSGERSGRTSSTSTSGYGGDLGGSNGVEDKPSDRRSSDGKKRAISQHLQDFDENASFVGDYGSSFGLDADLDHSAGSTEEQAKRQESDSESDEKSYDSGTSGIEGRYTLPPPASGSWENIDPGQVVEAHHRPTDI